MLKPLFSLGCEHLGWLDPGRFIFDTGMAPIAFIADGNAWSVRSGVWLGPVVNGHAYDLDGRPVAWSIDKPLTGIAKPAMPVRIVRPVTPVRPVRPVAPMRPLGAPSIPGGWSHLSFWDWLVFSDPPPEPAPDAPEPEEPAADEPTDSTVK